MITPKEAFEAANTLWPGAKKVRKVSKEVNAIDLPNGCIVPPVEIDWGNLTQYPLPPEEWRDAVFPDDVGKQGRVSDDGKNWVETMILGRFETGVWLACRDGWKYCQVKKEQA